MTMSIWEGKGISDRFLPKLPPPPHKIHINKNININDIGGQNNNMYFLAEFIWK